MENTFASTVPIDDDTDLDEAKGMVLGGIDAAARKDGYTPSRKQIMQRTAFGVVEKEDGTRLLQGIFTAE